MKPQTKRPQPARTLDTRSLAQVVGGRPQAAAPQTATDYSPDSDRVV